MTTAQVVRARFPRAVANLRQYGGAATRGLEQAGKLGWFALLAGRDIPFAVTRYRKELLRLVAEVGMGTGALAVIGGTAAIEGLTVASTGALVALQGFSALHQIGIEALMGFVAALINVRLVIPVVAGFALAAVVGAGATAELGAKRISEEIDALEVMGINSRAYLASTRAIAVQVVIVPLYALAMVVGFVAPQLITILMFGQASGSYEHYFWTFLRPNDVFWSFAMMFIIAGVVMLIHCYYGYTASGGPVGVGEAVGRSMRLSLIMVPVTLVLFQMALYGTDPNFNFTV